MSRVTVIVSVLLLIPAIAIGAVLFLLTNPDYYRPQLYATFEAETGLQLEIKGEMGWRYWPPIALKITDVEVHPIGSSAPLATMSAAAIDLALIPLLTGGKDLSINGINIDGLQINALVDKNGRANWEGKPTTAAKDTPVPTATPDTTEGLGLDIKSTEITDVIVDYQNQSAGAHYVITLPYLTTGNLRYDQLTDVDASLSVNDKVGGMQTTVEARGQITFDRNFSQFTFARLNISQTLNLPGSAPITNKLTLDGTYDVASAKLDTALAGTFDKSTVNGKLGANLATKPSVTVDLALDSINLNDYLGASTSTDAAASTPSTAPATDAEVLPRELLKAFDLRGQFRVDSINYSTYTFTDFTADIVNRAGKLTAKLAMKGYEGDAALNFTASADGRGAGQTGLKVTGIDITRLTGFKSITGKVNLDSDTTFTGHMLSDVMNSLDGITTFNISDGTMDVTPIKTVAAVIDGLRGQDSGIGSWADRMPFENLNGQHRFNKGTKADQLIAFKLENVDVTGNGGFDYFANQVRYDLALVMQETTVGQFRVAPGLAGIEWPLHCEGRLDQSPQELCLPDRSAIQKVITSLVKQKGTDAIKEKLQDLIPDKAKGLLDKLFR